jgi:hypothetical protein
MKCECMLNTLGEESNWLDLKETWHPSILNKQKQSLDHPLTRWQTTVADGSFYVLGTTTFKAERHISSDLRYCKDVQRGYKMGILRRYVERIPGLRVVVAGANPGVVPPVY